MMNSTIFLACLIAQPFASELEHVSVPIAGHLPKAVRAAQSNYDVVLRPDEDKAEWWAGAPSVVVDDKGVFWMACRMRTADAQRGLRGYEIRILKSPDGVSFNQVHSIHRDDIPIPGFERPALVRDPDTGLFKLYGCGPWQGGDWGIFKLDDVKSPDKFDPKTAKLVLGPPKKQYDRDQSVIEYKDPFIVYAEGAYQCYVTGYMRRNERIYHFTSGDGEAWQPVGNPYESIMPLAGWHDFFVRPGSVVPLGIGYLFVYEGSKTSWYDPVYNVATGIGFTFDLHTIHDLTPEAPLLTSSTPSERFATFRYSHWLIHEGELRIYAEVACPNETHEIRHYRVPLTSDTRSP